eukprot:s1_g218.t1
MRRDGKSLNVLDPETGETLETINATLLEDIPTLIADAERGAAIAREMSPSQRAIVLEAAAFHIELDAETYARRIALEGIKTIREARNEAKRCSETLRLSAQVARRIDQAEFFFPQKSSQERRRGSVKTAPIGVVAAITPYNDPLNLVAHKIGPAFAMGNSVILKPHEATPLSAMALIAALRDSGLPDNVVTPVIGDGASLGPPIIADDRIRMVTFTGGRRTGNAIVQAGGLKRYAMELGGVCSTIVCEDADIGAAVSDCVSGGFAAAGQNCVHSQRLLLHEGIYEEFKRQFLQQVAQIALGPKLADATDMGCMIDQAAADRVESEIAHSVSEGNAVILGGARDGTRIHPTVIEIRDQSSALLTTEVFGPVVTLERFVSLEECIDRTNRTRGAINGAIFSQTPTDHHLAIERMDAGSVLINGGTDFRVDAMPFGGTGLAGIGREGPSYAAAEMSQLKLVCNVER